jgi:hypothetical protein
MKTKILLFVVLVLATRVFSQNVPPVAVNDTAFVAYGDTITVNILANDFDPRWR